jgi:hypothetical protein
MVSSSCCKVGEVTNRYQVLPPDRFNTIDDYLISRWCGDRGVSKTGLRPLTDWLNKRLLKSVYTRQNRHQIETHISSDYKLLSDNDTEGDDLQTLLRDLRQDGIDGEAIASDFISPSTLHRHLTDCLDANKKRETSDRNWEREQVAQVRDRAAKNLRNVLTSLDNKGRVKGAADADISVSLYLRCPECNREIPFKQATNRGYVCQEHLPIDDRDPDQAGSEGKSGSPAANSNQTSLKQVLTNAE